MAGSDALWAGFANFFSVWQLCTLQISPFFVAFIVGAYLQAPEPQDNAAALRWISAPSAAFAVAFSAVYALLIASALELSRPLIARLDVLRIVAALLILLAGLQIMLAHRLPLARRLHRPAALSALAAFLGVSFALVYSPCITPALSDIMALATQRGTARQGWVLAWWYAIGTCLALWLVTLALVLAIRGRAIVRRRAGAIAGVCAVIVLALAFLNLTGLMTHYKAFALGFAL